MAAKPLWTFVYALLRGLAAESTRPVSYGQLATILRVMLGQSCHRRHVGGMLRKVYEQCMANGEPDLTAFVVGVADDQPSSGWVGWSKGEDPEITRKAAHEHFRKEVWGK